MHIRCADYTLINCVTESTHLAGLYLDGGPGVVTGHWCEANVGYNVIFTTNAHNVQLVGGTFLNGDPYAVKFEGTSHLNIVTAPYYAGYVTGVYDFAVGTYQNQIIGGIGDGSIDNSTENNWISVYSYSLRGGNYVTVPANAYSVVVTHGLVKQPKFILVSGKWTSQYDYYISNVNATQFTVNFGANSTNSVEIYWYAACYPTYF
jgi:hypothetical protein